MIQYRPTAAILFLALPVCVLLASCSPPREAVTLESQPGDAHTEVFSRELPAPLVYDIPQHPFMAPPGVNSMHSDAFSSDVHPTHGPRGINTTVHSRKGSRGPGGQCATVTFSSDGNLVALCTGMGGFRISLMAPRTLELLAEHKLGVRPSSWQALVKRDKRYIMEDSSGAYFFLDNEDRVVMAGSDHVLRRIAHRQNERGDWRFDVVDSWDLGMHVPSDCLRPSNPFPKDGCDPVTAVMPDFEGRLWWATRGGRVGFVNPDTGLVASTQLEGEEIQNGFSVAEEGVYIVSDHALYQFVIGRNGGPRALWREAYDRGSGRRVGSINQGSGTTPTLFGDYVTIADNADQRINLLVYRRNVSPAEQSERLVCSVPLFREGQSAIENSMIGIDRSVVIENNSGFTSVYEQSDWSDVVGGITRVDVREDESGCDVVWESQERVPSVVPKLAAKNGIAYFYTFEPLAEGYNAWYLTGLDFHTGKTLFRIHTGNGEAFNNNWAPITLAPDGTAYVGTAQGIVAIRDQPM